MKITIVGLGYVGTSMSFLLARNHKVVIFDIDKKKISNFNKGISPIDDPGIKKAFKKEYPSLIATTSEEEAFTSSDFIIISTPTNFDAKKNYFDLSSIEITISKALEFNPRAVFIIKSTIPIGCTEALIKKFNHPDIYFSPEFLREGRALQDNLYPSRIIIGSATKKSRQFIKILKDASKIPVKLLTMSSKEAEAVKLFANSFLALRVAYFNELDNFALSNGLDSKAIIEGVSYDNRIGNYYNNPSFGYGGYCLPKDTKQLLANYHGIPNSVISAIVSSNELRKKFLVKKILAKKPNVVGIYRLAMKSGSDNWRSSAILDLMDLISKKSKVIIYEPVLGRESFLENIEVINNFKKFAASSDIILANRIDSRIKPFKNIVFTRDIFSTD